MISENFSINDNELPGGLLIPFDILQKSKDVEMFMKRNLVTEIQGLADRNEVSKLRTRMNKLEKERAYLDTKFRQLVNCIGLQTYVSENERLEKERDEIQSVANQLQKAFITEERENDILEQRNATLVEALKRISQYNPHIPYCGTCSHFKMLAEQALSSADPTPARDEVKSCETCKYEEQHSSSENCFDCKHQYATGTIHVYDKWKKK